MADVSRSLDDITTGFTIFEKNQILTHDQLNDLGRYLDDQERLTRVGADRRRRLLRPSGHRWRSSGSA